jgi:hypothetical protein
MSAKEIVRNALISHLKALLLQCTTEQQEKFSRIFPDGFMELEELQLRGAVDLCERTVAKNLKEQI